MRKYNPGDTVLVKVKISHSIENEANEITHTVKLIDGNPYSSMIVLEKDIHDRISPTDKKS